MGLSCFGVYFPVIRSRLTVFAMTGLPKPIVHTNKTMVFLDAAKTMFDAHEETLLDHYGDGRWYSPVPSLHVLPLTTTLHLIGH